MAELFKAPEVREYRNKMPEVFGVGDTGMSFVKKKSMRNQFYYGLITPIEEKISVSGATLHVFYAKKMREQYRKRYERHFDKADICEYDLQHERLLVSYPKRWAEEIKGVKKYIKKIIDNQERRV